MDEWLWIGAIWIQAMMLFWCAFVMTSHSRTTKALLETVEKQRDLIARQHALLSYDNDGRTLAGEEGWRRLDIDESPLEFRATVRTRLLEMLDEYRSRFH